MVQWDKVCLQGLEPDGPFTFQAALYINGTIVFNYRVVSFPNIQQKKVLQIFKEKDRQLNILKVKFTFILKYTIFTLASSLHHLCFFKVPLPLEKINSTEHPVKVGLSDAFMALLPSSQSSGQ